MPSPVAEALQFAEYAAGLRRRRDEEAMNPWRRLLIEAQVHAAQQDVEARRLAMQPVTLPSIERPPREGIGPAEQLFPAETIPPGPAQGLLTEEALRRRQPGVQQSQAISDLERRLVLTALQRLARGEPITPEQSRELEAAKFLAKPPRADKPAKPKDDAKIQRTLIQQAMKATGYSDLAMIPATKSLATQRIRSYLDQTAPEYLDTWKSRWPLPGETTAPAPSPSRTGPRRAPPPGTRVRNPKTGQMGTWDGTKIVPDQKK